jgi:hypothetical protein
MKLVALEIPDDTAALAGWLQDHLVGLDLAPLVAELEAVHGAAQDPLTVDQVLGSHRDAVLAHGLGALPPKRLRQLLLKSRLLLDLQELVLTGGGPFWSELAAPSATSSNRRAALDRTWKKIDGAVTPATAPSASRRAQPVAQSPRLLRFPVRRLLSLAAAAVMLVAVFVAGRHTRDGAQRPQPGPTASTGWGWNRPDALRESLTPREYLTHLADAAQEWFNKRPDEPLALARRIGEFRQGCSTLILSQHRPLAANDRTWLVDKCRAWAAKLDAHLAALEGGQDPIKVREAADETIDKLIVALRERAKNLA